MSEYITAYEAAKQIKMSPAKFAMLLKAEKDNIPTEINYEAIREKNAGFAMFAPKAYNNFYDEPNTCSDILWMLKIHLFDWEHFAAKFLATSISESDLAQEHISAWEKILPELRGADLKAAKLAIAKCSGLKHISAYLAVFPDGNTSNAVDYVSKKRSRAESIANTYGLTMPKWDSSN